MIQTYYYRLLLPHGVLRSGLLRMSVERELSVRLRLERETDGTVVHLWRLPGWLAAGLDGVTRLFTRPLQGEDLAGLLRDLALMMRAGVPALDAFATLQDESHSAGNAAVHDLVRQMSEELKAGVSVTDVFERHPHVFPETVRNLVSIGERSGALDRMLQEAADHVDRLIQIRRDIKTALIYPVFVFATIFAVAGFWIYYVVPNMARLFRQLQAKLPPLTVWLVSFADMLTQYLPWVLGGVLLTTTLGVWSFKRSERIKAGVYSVLHRLPIAKTLLTASGMAYLTEHLAILVRAGVDMVSSLRVLSRATQNRYYRGRLQRVSEAVSRGDSVASAMRRVGGFPAMAVRMVAVGEESGSLDAQLTHLADEYRKRLDVLVRSLAEILKPAIILVAGGLFLFLIVALLLPVYDLVRQSVGQTLGA